MKRYLFAPFISYWGCMVMMGATAFAALSYDWYSLPVALAIVLAGGAIEGFVEGVCGL